MTSTESLWTAIETGSLQDEAVLLRRLIPATGLDLPGCGHSAKPRHPYRLADMVGAVRGLLDELRIEKALIFGHSYGGRVATELALESPERVAGLMLMSSAGFVRYNRILHLLGPALLHEKLVTTLSLSVNRAVLRLLFGNRKEGLQHRERFLSQVLDRYDPRFGVEFARYTVPMLSELMSELHERLPSLKTPVQVLWGEADHLISLDDAREGIAQLPNAQLEVLPGCGHMANLEQPEAVTATALRFQGFVFNWPGEKQRAPALEAGRCTAASRGARCR